MLSPFPDVLPRSPTPLPITLTQMASNAKDRPARSKKIYATKDLRSHMNRKDADKKQTDVRVPVRDPERLSSTMSTRRAVEDRREPLLQMSF
jgi:hypothetical protein